MYKTCEKALSRWLFLLPVMCRRLNMQLSYCTFAPQACSTEGSSNKATSSGDAMRGSELPGTGVEKNGFLSISKIHSLMGSISLSFPASNANVIPCAW